MLIRLVVSVALIIVPVILPGCLQGIDFYVYNATEGPITLKFRRGPDARMYREHSIRIPVRQAEVVQAGEDQYMIRTEAGVVWYYCFDALRHPGFEAQWIRRGWFREYSVLALQVNADGCLYMVRADDSLPRTTFEPQPRGFPVQPRSDPCV
jgi:hypothetical protein